MSKKVLWTIVAVVAVLVVAGVPYYLEVPYLISVSVALGLFIKYCKHLY